MQSMEYRNTSMKEKMELESTLERKEQIIMVKRAIPTWLTMIGADKLQVPV